MPFLAPIGFAAGVGTAATATAAATGVGAASLVGGGLLAGGALSLLGAVKGAFGDKTPDLPALPTTPTIAQAEGTSLEEQRDILRRKSKTTLTSPNLLATQGEAEKKTLLGA